MSRLLWKSLRAVIVAGIVLAVVGGVFVGFALVTPLPRPELPDATEIYDVNGRLITRLRGPNFENRTTIAEADMPDYLRNAVVAVEDERFYRHYGIDPVAIARAAYRDIKARKVVEGGSTITQQLAKNLFLTQARTWERKIREVFYTVKLEAAYSKDEILTLYLNQIYLGHGAYGVEAASQLYFGKPARELTLAEAATLAGLIRWPEHYTPYRHPEEAVKRRDLVLGLMVDQGYIDRTAADEARKEPMQVAGLPETSNPAPHFVSYVVDQVTARHPLLARNVYTGGYKIYTTLDLDAQSAANHALEANLGRLDQLSHGDGDQVQVALVAVDPTNGYVTAMIGGRHYTGDMNRAVAAKRQPGSAFKAVVYTAVLERGYTAIDTQVCEHVEYPNGDGTMYVPKDHTESKGQPYHDRPLTVREAVAVSDNVVAVRWANQIKPAAIIDMAQRMGIPIDQGKAREAGLSLALGSYEVTPLQLAVAYTTLANSGYRVEPMAVLRVVDPEGRVLEDNSPHVNRVITEQLAYLMTDILKSTFDPKLDGTASHLAWILGGRPAAGKTGTSQDQVDTWFAGYTPDLACAVWVGFDERKPIGEQAWGGTLPGPIWADFMAEALKDTSVTDFPVPNNIVRVEICKESNLLPDFYFTDGRVTEVFLRGTEPPDPCPQPLWEHYVPWFGPDKHNSGADEGSAADAPEPVPANPKEPEEPEAPEQPVEPVEPEVPTQPESPAEPVEPQPEEPGSGDPVGPSEPEPPPEPVEPEEPVEPPPGVEPGIPP